MASTWIVTRGTADIRWRVEMPAQHLGAKTIVLSPEEQEFYETPNDEGKFRWAMSETEVVYPDIEGTVVWTRPNMLSAIHGVAMSDNGHRVVGEVDDNYLSPANQNIFMRRAEDYDTHGRRLHLRALATMDAIICSTALLRDTYAKVMKKEMRLKPSFFVARNHVDPDDWVEREPIITSPKKGVRVGWAGSHQHIWDLRLAAPALHLAKEMGAEIVLIGLDPAMHDPGWREFLGDYTHVPWTAPDDYHRKTLNIDIGVIPLVMNSHTLGKSDVKCLEYAMSGAAIVAQNNPVYNTHWKHNETCLLAGDPDHMALEVRDLILDQKLRRELTSAAKEYVLSERTIQKNLHEWSDAVAG